MFSALSHNVDVGVKAADLSEYPAEDPTRAQLEDWYDRNVPALVRSGYGPAMRGDHPGALLPLAAAAEVPDIPPLTAAQRREVSPTEAARHDQLVEKTRRDRALAARQLHAQLQEYHNRFAAILESAMRPKASMRLKALQRNHQVTGVAGCYNGGAMWRELALLRNTANRLEDMRDHDRAVEAMRDSPLQDGCSAQDFADKVNKLTRDHLRFLERPLQGVALSKFIVNLMPNANQAEGRALIRELDAVGDLSDTNIVIARCTEIVKDSAIKAPRSDGVLASLLVNKGLGEKELRGALQNAGFSSEQATVLAMLGRKPAGSKDPHNKKNKHRGALRLPEGKLCKEGTCNFDHEKLAPGEPCFRSPHFKGPLPDKYAGNEQQYERIDAARKANAVKMGVPYVPLLKNPKKATSAACGIIPADDTSDGLDYGGLFSLPADLCCAVKLECFEERSESERDSYDSYGRPIGNAAAVYDADAVSVACASDTSDEADYAQWEAEVAIFSPAERAYSGMTAPARRGARSPLRASAAYRWPDFVPETPEMAAERCEYDDSPALTPVHAAQARILHQDLGSDELASTPSTSAPAGSEFGELRHVDSEIHESARSNSLLAYGYRAAFGAGAAAAAGMLTVLALAAACVTAFSHLPAMISNVAFAATTPDIGSIVVRAVGIGRRASSLIDSARLDWATLVPYIAVLYLLLPTLMRWVCGIGFYVGRLVVHLPSAKIAAQHLGASAIALVRRLAADVIYAAIKLAVVVAVCSYFIRPAQGAFVGALSTSRNSMCSKVLNFADSGAGVHAICDARFAIPGTLRANETSIYTASGSASPKQRCDAKIDVLTAQGRVVQLVLHDALIMEGAQHNLVSLGLLARSHGVVSHIGAGSDESYLLFPDATKVNLMNRGVFIIPDRDDANMINAVVPAASRGENEVMWETIHNRFNGRSYEVLRHLVTSGKTVTRDWLRALKSKPRQPCHSCLLSRADRIPSHAHVPSYTEPGYISYDIFEMGVRHMQGGQRYLIGFHDAYSRLNKIFLLHQKSDAHKAMDLMYAWANSHGVTVRRFHADNAPELTGPALVDLWAKRGVRLTACAPHVPRGNGMMERQWRTIANDTRHALALAQLPPGAWWYVARATVIVSWSIPINAHETPWSRFTGRASSPHVHRVVGCLAYYRVVKPASKAHMRARRAIHLGRAENQPGYLLMDLETGMSVVTPHVRFVENVFPGLTKQPSGGEPSQEDMDRLFDDLDDPARADTVPALEDWGLDGPSAVSGSHDTPSSVDSGPDPIDPVEPTPDDQSDASSIDGTGDLPAFVDENSDEISGHPDPASRPGDGAAAEGPISSRLQGRPRRPVDRFAYGVSQEHVCQPCDPAAPIIDVPESGGYYMYIGAGPARDGDVASHLRALGGSPILCIDHKRGGYDHDITHAVVQRRLLAIAANERCLGAFVSIPCKTFSVLRGKPGVEHSYPLRDIDHVLGIPRTDGTLPYKVQQSNVMSDFAAELMLVVHNNGGVFAAESPPSRNASSRFPIEGRETHVSQFDHPAWISLRDATDARMIYFDQCTLHEEPSKTARKKTALLVNPKGFKAFHERFAPLVCSHGYDAHRQAYGLDSKGNFVSPTFENYPDRMNALIAEALVESCESPPPPPRRSVSFAAAAAAPPVPTLPVPSPSPSPIDQWHAYCTRDDDMCWPAQPDVPDRLEPMMMLSAAASLLGTSFSNRLYHTSIDDQLFAAHRETSCDNPTFRQARASSEWPAWEKACDDEILNLRRNGTVDEDQSVLEDTLPSWNAAKGRADEVVNVLWVLKKKYNDGVFDKYKARAVFDGRDQKAKNPGLETFSPACRSTTHKLIAAEACRLGHRQRTWDVEAAYLKGVFPSGSKPLLARPPPGYRTYINGVAVIWVLNTPLYGEADAGRIWYKTFVAFLINERGFTQSRYDPCYFWKVLPDGSRMNCVIYVDDGYSTDNGSEYADKELEAINERFKIVIKDASFFLGNNILCHSRNKISLSSRAYIERIASKYLLKKLDEYPIFDVPCDKSIVQHYEDALSRRRSGSMADKVFQAAYASKVGALIYVVPVCRVDCAFTIGMLARCLTFPTPDMDAAADRCLVYLAQHPDQGVTFDASAPRPELHAFSDSNWSIGHSTSGWAILYCGAVIGYGSKRQQSIALSSTEAEIMAASMAATEILYFRGLLAELGHELDPTVLYVDNQGAVELSRDMKSCQRSRHIERRYLKVRELVASGEVVVKHVDTASNPADVLTKPLDLSSFSRHVSSLTGGASIP